MKKQRKEHIAYTQIHKTTKNNFLSQKQTKTNQTNQTKQTKKQTNEQTNN